MNKAYSLTENINKIILQEMNSKELVELEENFYSKTLFEAQKYKNYDFYEAFRLRLVSQLKTLFVIRLYKVMNGASAEFATSNERVVFEKYNEFVNALQRFLRLLLEPEKASIKSKKLVIFKVEIHDFIDSTMKSLGSFTKGDIAYIPEEDAILLSKFGLVEMLGE
ncbi:hypothetical protein B9Q12_02150 [Candidatus Marsarchaeota G2 archaeon ECH_B_SAG-G06]|uniref:DNA replication complex GINS family protein n=2 Tax=Candidatus Marsarchaeota group 2 TaxID=2203771 RepID=A0A2R6C165_9ARCH|nr:MAG: hypothetical protein B9Q10_00085 [Candidatus Marsarchaeota G2 archaeon ECH_B_SAG-E12]PSO04594.1 MAG: hypothetical protein B9Q12_02150 [Candidatus Marsarchaeota G2 archaeon ECH_B_SAG-G06]